MLRLAVSMCLLAACSSQSSSQSANVDCRERVVSLHDVTTEAVLRYEGRGCLVGVSEPTDLAAELRPLLQGIPRVESTESVLGVRPTQVLALAIVTEHQPDLFRELTKRGISWTAPRLERIDDVRRLASDVAVRIDRVAASRKFSQKLEALRAPLNDVRKRVFVFDCCAPPFTAGGRAVITDLLAHAGATNVFADVDDDWFHASWEAAIQRKPELVVIDDYGDPSGLAKKRAALEQVAPLAELPILVLPLRDALGTIRSADVIQQLTAAIARNSG